MPLYAWYVLVVGVMILFAFPPLTAGDLLFELERTFDWPFFDPERGGDPLLWQHLFWIFGHREIYVIFLPSIAIAAMVVPTAAQRPVVGYNWIVLSAVGVGFLSFGLRVHHMFTNGRPSLSIGFFSAASEAVVIQTGVQIFAFVATLMAGRVKMITPMLWIAGALAIFTMGGLTGVLVALAPFDWQVHDTYFVAHLHYTLFGGMIFPIIGGVYYFYPFFTKKMMSDRLSRISFWLIFGLFFFWTAKPDFPHRHRACSTCPDRRLGDVLHSRPRAASASRAAPTGKSAPAPPRPPSAAPSPPRSPARG